MKFNLGTGIIDQTTTKLSNRKFLVSLKPFDNTYCQDKLLKIYERDPVPALSQSQE